MRGAAWVGIGLLWLVGLGPAGPAAGSSAGSERRIEFPDVEGWKTLVIDFHTHSVFSDGHVWPTLRVREAMRDGLDAFAVTEHLEHQPHAADIPHPDRNRAHALALEEKEKQGAELLVVNGAEITREMPPGHVNAVFVRDANLLLHDDVEEVFREANRQDAFVFWNHPYWVKQTPDGIARLREMHSDLITRNLLHGIEVANGTRYSAGAFRIALDHDLTILGVSDVHGLVDWSYDLASGGHRTVTLVFAKDTAEFAIKEALRARRTVAWSGNMLIGREDQVGPLVRASLRVKEASHLPDSTIARVVLENVSDAEFLLRSRDEWSFYDATSIVTVSPHSTQVLDVKTGDRLARFELEFEVLNALIAPSTHPVLRWEVSIE